MGCLTRCFGQNEEPCSLTHFSELGPEQVQAAAANNNDTSLCQDKPNKPACASGTVPCPSQADAVLLPALQSALAALEGDGFEGRATLLASTIQEHLGPSAVVRLYGLTPDDNDSQVLHLVQLAATAGQVVAWPRWADETLPGRSLALFSLSVGGLGLTPSSTPSYSYPTSGDRGDAHVPLLEIALGSKRPATFSLDSPHVASGANAGEAPVSLPPLPRDCAAELGAIRHSGQAVFAAVPLCYGKHMLGALWVALAAFPGNSSAIISAAGELPFGDSATLDPSSPTRLCPEQVARSQMLLKNSSAMEQLGLSASMALALAAGGDTEYVSWLASCVRRLASSATLHALVAGIGFTISQHVRLRFYSDVAVQMALVPKADSTVAFMLFHESKSTGGLFGPICKGGFSRDMVPEALSGGLYEHLIRAKSGVISKPSRQPVRRVVSQALLQPPETSTEPRHASGTAAATTTMPLLTFNAMGGLVEKPVILASPQAGSSRDRDAGDSNGTNRTVRALAGPTSAVSAPVLCMSAKAFQLSHTLLSRLVSNTALNKSRMSMPTGIIIADTARHVADVRQPSRDVCMLIGAKCGMAASVWQQSGAPGGSPGFTDQSGSRCGPASLVLLAMEVADGGCALALYVAFPNLMPYPLLAAAKDSCEQLLTHMMVSLIRQKLQSSELGPDLDTLRAGVPGSYVSVSRIQEHVDLLQLPMGSFTPAPGANAASDRLELHQTPQLQDLEVHLNRMAAWNTSPAIESPRVDTKFNSSWNHNPQHPNAHLMHQAQVHQDCDPLSAESPAPWAGREDARSRIGISPLPATKLLLARDSSAHQSARPGLGECCGANPSSAGIGAGCNGTTPTLPVTAQFCVSTHGVTSVRTASCASGLPSCNGVGSQGVMSTVMLDSNADGQDGRLTQAAVMTVHGVDDTWGMRGMMGALVESIMTTLQASVSELVDEAIDGAELGNIRAVEGLEDLHLAEVLGHGASGVVLRGTLGTVPVAVKLMEMPDADYVVSTEGGLAHEDLPEAPGSHERSSELEPQNLLEEPLVRSLASMGPSAPSAKLLQKTPEEREEGRKAQHKGQHQVAVTGPGTERAAGPPLLRHGGRLQTESEQLRARFNMLRNATELAVMRLVSHVCIVQAFAVYDNVIMERPPDAVNSFVLRRLDPKNPETGGSPICTAIVQELCDCGSLADVLSDRSFPNLIPRTGPGPRAGGLMVERSAGSRLEIDMKGVYLTLLEITLALKHLHSRRLVHRDLKPANILLKSSPGDPRGWTCKLADFGFALVLDQQDKGSEYKEDSNKAGGAGAGAGGPNGPGATSGRSCWYTVQAHASGTVTHMAPEAVVKNSRIDSTVDIYALGIIFWELVCGRGQRPFRHLEPGVIPSAVVAGMRPVFLLDVPVPFRKMAQACWAQEPHRRPRAADVVSFIKSQLAALA